MTAYEYLGEIERKRVQIELIKAELDAMMESINLLPGVSFDGVRVQTTSTDSKVLQMVVLCNDKRSQLFRKIEEYEKARNERIAAIDRLGEPKLIEVLTLRYVKGLYFWDVASRMKRSESSVYDLHAKALKAMEDVIE